MHSLNSSSILIMPEVGAADINGIARDPSIEEVGDADTKLTGGGDSRPLDPEVGDAVSNPLSPGVGAADPKLLSPAVGAADSKPLDPAVGENVSSPLDPSAGVVGDRVAYPVGPGVEEVNTSTTLAVGAKD